MFGAFCWPAHVPVSDVLAASAVLPSRLEAPLALEALDEDGVPEDDDDGEILEDEDEVATLLDDAPPAAVLPPPPPLLHDTRQPYPRSAAHAP